MSYLTGLLASSRPMLLGFRLSQVQDYEQLITASRFHCSAVIVFVAAGRVLTGCSMANASQHSTSSWLHCGTGHDNAGYCPLLHNTARWHEERGRRFTFPAGKCVHVASSWVCDNLMEFVSEYKCCWIPTFFCKSKIRQIFIRLDRLGFNLHIHLLSQSDVSHTEVNSYTMNTYWLAVSYLLMSVTLYRFGF